MKGYLLISLLLSAACCSYVLNRTQSLPSQNFIGVALAPRPTMINGSAYDIVLGYDNGTILLANTDDFHTQTTFDVPSNTSIVSLQWNSIGITFVSSNAIKVTDPTSMGTKLELIFNQTFSSVAIGSQIVAGSPRIITAFSFNDRIQIYEDGTFIMRKPTKFSCQTLAIDDTGKYLYYFDNFTRFIINIVTRSVFDQQPTSTNYIGVVMSSRAGYEDISLSLNSQGCLQIWDDYGLLSSYTNLKGQTQLMLTENSNYLVTYSPSNSAIYMWYTNYNNFTTWSTMQSISTSRLNRIAMDAKNSKLVYLSSSSVIIYVNDTSGVAGLVVIIVFVSFFCCCALCITLHKKYNIRNIFNGTAFRNRTAHIDQFSANYAGIKQNKPSSFSNNINESTYSPTYPNGTYNAPLLADHQNYNMNEPSPVSPSLNSQPNPYALPSTDQNLYMSPNLNSNANGSANVGPHPNYSSPNYAKAQNSL